MKRQWCQDSTEKMHRTNHFKKTPLLLPLSFVKKTSYYIHEMVFQAYTCCEALLHPLLSLWLFDVVRVVLGATQDLLQWRPLLTQNTHTA